MFNDIINAIPYIFMILHSVGLWNTTDDIQEIKKRCMTNLLGSHAD